MKSKISVILLGVFVFLLGGIAGAVSHYIWREHFPKTPAKQSAQRFDIAEVMSKELKLDAAQKEKLKVIVVDIRKRTKALNQQFRPRYEAVNKDLMSRYDAINMDFMPQFEIIRKESDKRIRAILREDQKILFEDFLKKWYQRLAQMKLNTNKVQPKN
jgi:uncharacterized membrane protein